MPIKKIRSLSKAPPRRIYADMDVCNGLQVIVDNINDRMLIFESYYELVKNTLPVIERELGKLPNNRIDWQLVITFLKEKAGSISISSQSIVEKYINIITQFRKWISTNGELLTALKFVSEIADETMRYINDVKELIGDMVKIARLANCPTCMKASPKYLDIYMNVYKQVIDRTNAYIARTMEWNDKCSKQLNAELCNYFYSIAKDIVSTVKKHVDNSIYDC